MSTVPTCPACGQSARLVPASTVYGGSLPDRYLWLCDCTAGLYYVGCHPGTTDPLGTLADRGLRNLRRIVHDWLDPIWKQGRVPRSVVYAWLARQMGIDRETCHVAHFDRAECFAALTALKAHPYHARRLAQRDQRPDMGQQESAAQPQKGQITVYQKFTAIGNLGSKPVLRYTPSGAAVADFNFAVNNRRKDKEGVLVESTVWFKVTAWQALAEVVANNLDKGRQVLVEGEITKIDAFLAQDGSPRASCVVTAQKVVFLGGHAHKTGTEGDRIVPPEPMAEGWLDNDLVPF